MTAAENLDPDESLWNAIAFHLRYERQKRGMSQTEVGNIIGVNQHGVSNAEAGRNKVTSAQAARLDKAWDTGGLFLRPRRFARLSHNPDWPAQVDRYKRGSDQIKIFHNGYIPIPFQTEDYARGLLTVGHAAGLVEDVESAVVRRINHQAAILERLIECSLLPHVSLRVVPLTAAPHLGIDGWF